MVVEVDRRDVTCVERFDFVWFGDPVVVQVAPEHELRPDRILVIDDAIVIGIKLGQSLKAVLRQVTILQMRKVTEQLGAAGDPMVMIAVQPEERLVFSCCSPPDEPRVTAAAHVEEHRGVCAGEPIPAVSEVDDNRAALWIARVFYVGSGSDEGGLSRVKFAVTHIVFHNLNVTGVSSEMMSPDHPTNNHPGVGVAVNDTRELHR